MLWGQTTRQENKKRSYRKQIARKQRKQSDNSKLSGGGRGLQGETTQYGKMITNVTSLFVHRKLCWGRRGHEYGGCAFCRSRTSSWWWVVHSKQHVQSVRQNSTATTRARNDAAAATRSLSTSTGSAGTGSSCLDATRPTTAPASVRSSTCRRTVQAPTFANNSSKQRRYGRPQAPMEVLAVRRGVSHPFQCCTMTSTWTSSTADYRKWSSSSVAARSPLPSWRHLVTS